MIKVSIVIPVYNGEAYLRQCLDSVCAQTLAEIEIICVDDGSTDASWRILEEYRDKDNRFRLIRQENQHVAAARNNGLAQAQGKYVIFWDCDDFFEPCALELLYLRAEETQADICVCRSDHYYQKNGIRYPDGGSLNLKRIPEGKTFNRFTNPENILGFSNAAVRNKLFRKSFLTENDLTFPGFQISEDRAFLYLALCLASRIATVNKVLIHYRWNNPKSLMGSRIGKSIEDMRSLEYSVEQLRKKDIVPEGLGKKVIEAVIYNLHWTNTEEDFKAVIQYLRENGRFEKLDIREREPEYYYSPRHHEFVKHLLHDEAGDVLAFFMHDCWQDLQVVKAERRKAREQIEKLKKRVTRDAETYKKELAGMTMENERLAESLEKMTARLAEQNGLLQEAEKKLKTTRKQLKTTKETLAALQNSRSYRLGRMLLYLPRKIRGMLRKLKHKPDALHG